MSNQQRGPANLRAEFVTVDLDALSCHGHLKAISAEHEALFPWILSGVEALGERTVERTADGED